MRRPVRLFVLLALVATAPAAALAQGSAAIEGFGGLSLNALQTRPPSFGGAVSFDAVPSIQIVGEAGRLGNVLPSLANAVFSLARADLRASALYGDAGIRFLAAPRAVITPYAEATGGVAQLSVSSGRLSPLANAGVSLAMGLVGRATPMAGAGGGILVRGGPIVFDVGYRYKQLFANDIIRTALGLGQPLRTHQVRAGIGVRF